MKRYTLNKWSEEEEEIIINNYPKMNINQLSSKLKRSNISVSNRVRWLKSKGQIEYIDGGKPEVYTKYGKDLINKIRKYYSKFGLKGTVEFFKLSEQKIKNIVSSLGIKFHLSKKRVTRIIDMDSFLKFGPESIYLLGFVWGDGHISKDGKVAIEIEANDGYNISPYIMKFGNWAIYERDRGENKKPQVNFYISDKNFYEFFINSGYLVKKNQSAYPILNKIQKDMWFYWFRGFFDSDGHISFEEDEFGNRKKISFSLTSSYEQNWDFVIDLFKELGIVNYQIYKRIHKNNQGKFSAIRITEFSEIKKFLDYIYQDKEYICLGRKYIIYKQIIENYNFRMNHPFFKYYDKY